MCVVILLLAKRAQTVASARRNPRAIERSWRTARTHGSSLLTRGVTQGMNIVTLAPLSFAQIVDTMEVTDGERRYMHHYNAPGYTVGEVRRLGSPGRREIGHGYLAERAVLPVLPTEEEFPYAIRSVTEIMSQNGSTSMAATCSSVLALMDAGGR